VEWVKPEGKDQWGVEIESFVAGYVHGYRSRRNTLSPPTHQD
jgi:hypothetical protein